jgi:hypothetical protein
MLHCPKAFHSRSPVRVREGSQTALRRVSSACEFSRNDRTSAAGCVDMDVPFDAGTMMLVRSRPRAWLIA